jgi:uncharacterized tellurite resistance protein B-like protein
VSDDFLGDRKKALEDSFFAKQNAELLERMRAERAHQATREELERVSGLNDPEVLAKLVELGIAPETWSAISLVPLVEVAWADGQVDDKERVAVLSGAEANGVIVGSPAHQLLEGWLARRPDARLLAAWGEFTVALCARLGATERASLKKNVLGRAREVAAAAGGFLGLGNKISPEEEVVLEQLAKAFDTDPG